MKVAVFGAYGHTGRFIVAELLRSGWTAVLSGRDREKLEELRETFPDSECRVASVEDPDSLDAALSGSMAVINGAGPFLDTPARSSKRRSARPSLTSTLRRNSPRC